MASLDLSTPSFAGAVHFAREAGFQAMRAGRRDTPSEADKAAGNGVLARLLWLVEAEDGGFMGRSDAGLEAYAARLRLPMDLVNDAMWNPGHWPVVSSAAAVAA